MDKHEVAKQSVLGRTSDQTAEQTKAALKKIDRQLCTNIIQHTERLMSEWMTSADAGSLSRFASFHQLKCASEAKRKQCTDLSLAEAQMVGEVEEEKENRPPSEN